MKKILPSLLLLLCSTAVFAQVPTTTVSPGAYDSLKNAGALNPSMHYNIVLPSATGTPNTLPHNNSRAGGCGCYIEPDGSYTVAMAPNDDGSTGLISIPFNFCLYGQTWNELYINNNGNVSFGSSYSTFSSNPFPTSGFTMVAPFWGDVDTRSGGVVYYKITPTAMYVNWEDVGYYSQHNDKVNTFQLIITDGNDPIIGVGNNVAFCYQDMQWTTGDASSGSGGFGGVPATVGCNNGNGTDFVQFGRFDSPGTQYFGPFASNSQVSWLDYQSFTFNACSNTNIPPAIAGNIGLCDTLFVCLNDTFTQTVQILSPELGQFTTVQATSLSPDFTVLSVTNGNTAELTFQIVGSTIGTFDVNIVAWDDGTPPDTINFNLTIQVNDFPAVPPSITGNLEYCQGNNTVLDAGSGYDSYEWNNSGGIGQTSTVSTPGLWIVEVTSQGCRAWDSVMVVENPNPLPVVNGGTLVCQGDSTQLAVTAPFVSYNWSNSETSQDIWVQAGSYTVSVTDTNGCTGTSQPFNVAVSNPVITINGIDEYCEGDSTELTLSPLSNFTSFTWSDGSAGSGTYATSGGWMSVTAIDTVGCTAMDSLLITENPLPDVGFAFTSVCDGVEADFQDTSTISSGSIVSTGWNLGDGNVASGQQVNHLYTTIGTYNVTLVAVSDKGCVDSTQAQIDVYENPQANFTYATQCFQKNTFFDQTTGGTKPYVLEWDLDNDGTPDEYLPMFEHKFPDSNDVYVALAVTDSNGCVSDTAILVNVKGGVQAPQMPDVMSLSSQYGNNKYDFQQFAPGFNDCINYTLYIYNRWGTLVYKAVNDINNPDLNCAGCFTGNTSTGTTVSPGTYYYVLNGNNEEGTDEITLQGTITIFD